MHEALLAIYSRLGTIEGKVNLVARADRPKLLKLLRETITEQPVIGQIYLLLDGARNQMQIQDKLSQYGVTVSAATLSRRTKEMFREHGIAERVEGPGGMAYRKDSEMERVLNLSRHVRRWLEDAGQVVPEEQVRRPRGSR